jgi:hypothetical protein
MVHRLFDIFVILIVGSLLTCTAALTRHAWKTVRTPDLSFSGTTLKGQELLQWIDLQIEASKQKVAQLDPGPAPPWYTPRYYYDWSPKAKLYGEAQDKLILLQKQKLKILEWGRAQKEEAKAVWNFGITPILHLLLAWTLLVVSLRMALRLALVRQKFGWVRL